MSEASEDGGEASSGFRWVEERPIHEGFIIGVANVVVEAPDGQRMDRDVIHHPGAVAVVPLHTDGTVTLVRQYRTPIKGELLEIPAGKRDVPGEAPELTAARELAEEVGLAAGQLLPLAQFYNSAGVSDELTYVFLGLDLRTVSSEAHGIEEEHMTIEQIALADVPAMVADARLCDAKTVIGLLAALRWHEAREAATGTRAAT